MSAATLRGTARTRAGAKPTGNPLPLLAVAEEGPGRHQEVRLGAGRRDRPALPTGQRVGAAARNRRPTCGRSPPPTTRRSERVHWAGSVMSGWVAADRASRLGHDGADDGTDLRGKSRGRVPALDPTGPVRMRALDERGGVVAGAHRRIAVPQRRDAALEGIEDRQLVAARCRWARRRAKASVLKSSREGLRLTSSAWLTTPRRWWRATCGIR